MHQKMMCLTCPDDCDQKICLCLVLITVNVSSDEEQSADPLCEGDNHLIKVQGNKGCLVMYDLLLI